MQQEISPDEHTGRIDSIDIADRYRRLLFKHQKKGSSTSRTRTKMLRANSPKGLKKNQQL